MTEINLEELFNSLDDGIRNDLDDWGKYMILKKFKELSQKVLELAAENAELVFDEAGRMRINKQSILQLIDRIK